MKSINPMVRHFLSKRVKAADLAVAILLAIAFILYIYNLTGWLINDDEGECLYDTWRMFKGDRLYLDFHTNQGPLFLFTGSILFKIFGTEVYWLRLATAAFTIFTAFFVFLIGRKVYNSAGTGILGMVFYLLLPVVYFQARFYRSDAYMVFFATLALFLFLKGWQEKKSYFFLYAGICYAIAFHYKAIAMVAVAAVTAFLIYQTIVNKSCFIRNVLIFFAAGFFLPVICSFLIITVLMPAFLTSFIGSILIQTGIKSMCLTDKIIGNLKEILMLGPAGCYSLCHLWLLWFALLVSSKYLREPGEAKRFFAFYLFGFFWVLFNPTIENTPRFLLYLFPIVVLVFADFILNIGKGNSGNLSRILISCILVFFLARVFIPGLISSIWFSQLKENDTLALAKYISENTKAADYVLTDYGEINFYARRKTIPIAAAFSLGAIKQGFITVDKLIKEIDAYPVRLIAIHERGGAVVWQRDVFANRLLPHHFRALINSPDGFKFKDYLKEHYLAVSSFDRQGQIFCIYLKK
jgi:hypothetical protein